MKETGDVELEQDLVSRYCKGSVNLHVKNSQWEVSAMLENWDLIIFFSFDSELAVKCVIHILYPRTASILLHSLLGHLRRYIYLILKRTFQDEYFFGFMRFYIKKINVQLNVLYVPSHSVAVGWLVVDIRYESFTRNEELGENERFSSCLTLCGTFPSLKCFSLSQNWRPRTEV